MAPAPRLLPPLPAPLSLIEVEPWHVEKVNGRSMFCVMPADYATLGRNEAELLRYLRDLRDHVRVLRQPPVGGTP